MNIFFFYDLCYSVKNNIKIVNVTKLLFELRVDALFTFFIIKFNYQNL